MTKPQGAQSRPNRSIQVPPFFKSSPPFLCLLCLLAACAPAMAQAPATAPPVTFTADQDRQNMMDQLGIKALRPGPSGNEKAPNHANYDESQANPYPNIPDPLVMNDGRKVMKIGRAHV